MKAKAALGLILATLCLVPQAGWAQAGELKPVKLNEPNKMRGLPLMQALAVRASVRDWSDKDLSLQDLSDLLWAANGVNRPDIKKRTAASAMNAQDVAIYVFTKDGVYLYDAAGHALVPVAAGDRRSEIAMARPGGPGRPPGDKPEGKPEGMPPGAKPEGAPPDAKPQTLPPGPPGGGRPSQAPVQLVLVSDSSRFGGGTPEQKCEWGAIDTGIVSQNIALFCAATGLGTRPRAAIAKDKLKALLKLTDAQHPFLEHPVGYLK